MNNLLQTLNEEEKRLIKTVSLNKEQILFLENEICESVGLIIEGEIEIVSYSFTGKEIVFNTLSTNMIFGNNLIFSSDPRYKGSVISKTNSNVALIGKKLLINLLKNNEAFLLEYLKVQSDTGKQLNFQIKLLSLESAEERFLYYLHSKGGAINYKSITSLARTIYLQRETLSRLITKLINKKIIIKRKNSISLAK